jgi:hypothetical protein
MYKEAPKLKLIQGGKTSPRIKLNMGLFLVCGILLFYVLVILYGV